MHEVDAMGGEIGRMADRCYLQKRVLNRSKVGRLGWTGLGTLTNMPARAYDACGQVAGVGKQQLS